jgi:hypothetical protein
MLQGVFNLSHNSKACQVSYGPTNLDMQLGDRNTALQLWWQNSHVNKEGTYFNWTIGLRGLTPDAV